MKQIMVGRYVKHVKTYDVKRYKEWQYATVTVR